MTRNSDRVTEGQGQSDRDRGMGTWRREMDKDKDRNRDRLTGPDVQGQRDRDKEDGNEYGQRLEQGQSDSARCTGTKEYGQGRGR